MSRAVPPQEQRLDRLQRASIGYAIVLLMFIGALVATGVAPTKPVVRDIPASLPTSAAPPTASGAVVADLHSTANTATPSPPSFSALPGTASVSPPPAPMPTPPAPIAAAPSLATPVQSITLQQTAALQQGVAHGLSLDPDGALALLPTVAEDFTSGTLDLARWQTVPWGGGGTAAVANGNVTVSIAAIRSRQAFVHRTLEVRARFLKGAQPLQNIAWSADLNGTTAILVSEPPGDPSHLYARIKREGEADRLVPLPVSLDDGAFHTYRIAWEATQVEFAVDGVSCATIPAILDQPMYAWLSAASALPLTAAWMRVLDYEPASGSFIAEPFDAGRPVVWQSLMLDATTPTGTDITVRTRTSADGLQWTPYTALANDGRIASPPGRYLQYILDMVGTPTSTPRITAITATALPATSGAVAVAY